MSDVFTFMPDELIWAIRREREEEARNVMPHTTRKADPERSVRQFRPEQSAASWIAPSLKAGSGRA
ncbi:MAG: hypothetical protein AAB092_03565 [Chloroflexota bacterium]